jgi:hypothetical protein
VRNIRAERRFTWQIFCWWESFRIWTWSPSSMLQVPLAAEMRCNPFYSTTYPNVSWIQTLAVSNFTTNLGGIAQGHKLDDRGFESRQGLRIFLFTTASRPALGHTQPPIQWVRGALFLGVKRSGREGDYSPPSSAEIKNAWSYTSTPQYAFMAWCSIKSTGITLPFTLPLQMTIQLHGAESFLRSW